VELYDQDALNVSATLERSDPDCVFCKIARGDLASTQVHGDARILAIEDGNPQAPTHLLVLPRDHFQTLGDVFDRGDGALVAALFGVATALGRERGGTGGYRIVVNTGREGGQTVGHVHLHVLAGRPMIWPPG
jgi:histidine triad (HIT) family protein